MDKAIVLKQAASVLKEKTNTFVKKALGASWSATVDELTKRYRKPPDIILNFYIKSSDNSYDKGASGSTTQWTQDIVSTSIRRLYDVVLIYIDITITQ